MDCEFLQYLFTNQIYSCIVTIIAITSLILWIIFMIRYICLKKIIHYIPEVESNNDFFGDYKNILVKDWVIKSMKLKNIFIFDETIDHLINYTYDNYNKFYKTRTNIRLPRVLDKNVKSNKFKRGDLAIVANDIMYDLNKYKTTDYICKNKKA